MISLVRYPKSERLGLSRFLLDVEADKCIETVRTSVAVGGDEERQKSMGQAKRRTNLMIRLISNEVGEAAIAPCAYRIAARLAPDTVEMVSYLECLLKIITRKNCLELLVSQRIGRQLPTALKDGPLLVLAGIFRSQFRLRTGFPETPTIGSHLVESRLSIALSYSSRAKLVRLEPGSNRGVLMLVVPFLSTFSRSEPFSRVEQDRSLLSSFNGVRHRLPESARRSTERGS